MSAFFMKAVINGDLEKVKLLLADPNFDPSANNGYPIRMASASKYPEIVKLLLADSRVDPSANDNSAIKWASKNNRIEVLKLLLADPRVDPSADHNSAIQQASYYGHFEFVKLLLDDPRVDPSANDNYAIRWASRNGHTEVVKLLLSDPRVDWRDISEFMKIRLMKDADITLKEELKASLLSINRITPKMRIDKEREKALIPKSVRKNIIYRAQYEELSLLKREIPPIKLIALANLLKVQYDVNISWKELCGKVKFRLLEML